MALMNNVVQFLSYWGTPPLDYINTLVQLELIWTSQRGFLSVYFLFLPVKLLCLISLAPLFIVSQAGRCDPGWFNGPKGKKCFKYYATSLQWNESETYCNGFGGNLAAITSSEELNFVQKLCGNDSNGCWVGGRSINITAGLGWKWSDNASSWNESIAPKTTLDSSCKNFSCYGFKSVDLCTSIISGAIIAERCNVTHASICTLDAGKWLQTNLSLIVSFTQCNFEK